MIWYGQALYQRPDSLGGAIALALGFGLMWFANRGDLSLARLAPLIFVYAASFPFLPDLFRGMVAFLIMGYTMAGTRLPSHWLSCFGLILLALPIIPHLDLFTGYPLRALVAQVLCFLFDLMGLDVNREGATLAYNGQQIVVDAPCSGIRMLWTGGFLLFATTGILKVSFGRTFLLGILAFLLVLVGNMTRSGVLFLMEADLLGIPKSWHTGVGLFCFAITGLLIVFTSWKFGGRPCAGRS